MKSVRFLVAVCLVLSLASCSLKPMWDIAGKWQQVEGTGTVEFNKNGTVTVQDGTLSFTTNFMFADPTHLKLDLGGLGDAIMEVSVSKDELTVTHLNGEVIKFHRAG